MAPTATAMAATAPITVSSRCRFALGAALELLPELTLGGFASFGVRHRRLSSVLSSLRADDLSSSRYAQTSVPAEHVKTRQDLPERPDSDGMGHWSPCCSPVSRPACWPVTATCWPRARVRRDRGRPRPARVRSAAQDSRREPADAGRGPAHPRPHRPHLVGAEGGRHLRLPGVHPPGGPVHADRPDPGFPDLASARSRSGLFRAPKQVVELDGDGEILDLGGIGVTVDHTPGHTRGSVVFRASAYDDGIAFTGDTLFKQSVGRTDLPGGSGRDLLNSIVSKLLRARRRHPRAPGHGARRRPSASSGIPTRSWRV